MDFFNISGPNRKIRLGLSIDGSMRVENLDIKMAINRLKFNLSFFDLPSASNRHFFYRLPTIQEQTI
jgi:hypothetical protein